MLQKWNLLTKAFSLKDPNTQEPTKKDRIFVQ